MAAASEAFKDLAAAHRAIGDARRRAAWDAAHPPLRPEVPRSPHVSDADSKLGDISLRVMRPFPVGPHRAETMAGETPAGLWLRARAYERIPDGVLQDERLFEISAWKCLVGRGDVEQIAANPAIRRVSLGDTDIGDDDVALLCTLPHLEMLTLDGTRITDQACRHIGQSTTLQELSLQDTAVGDDGMALLSTCARLHALDLRGTKVTGEGLASLDELRLWRISLPAHTHWGDRRRLHAAHPDVILT